MAEYIEREAAIRVVNGQSSFTMTRSSLIDSIGKLPAADVVPVVHGRWVEYQIPPIICCSNCDWATGIEEKNFQYCPNCGAKMDGGADNC